MPEYNLQALKEAILFNTLEVLPSDNSQLEAELEVLIDNANRSQEPIRHYIGFEISGRIHLGTGMMTAIKIKKLQDAGVRCSVYLADYHTWLNEKLDGKLETIRLVRDTYFKPAFLECCRVAGCDVQAIDFVDAHELYASKKNGFQYWDFMMKVAKNLTLSRVNKSITITGKQSGDGVSFGVLCYPVMQVSDAFFMQSHIVHAGIDQRKCHVLMREIAGQMDEGFALQIGDTPVKPIACHHHLLLSLGVSAKDAESRMTTEVFADVKMSKSKPDTAVWVDDESPEIERKIRQAYCPAVDLEQSLQEREETQSLNPILNWCQRLMYPAGRKISLLRPEKFGGDKLYLTYAELYQDYLSGKIHPLDLKSALSRELSDWLAPICQWSGQNPEGLRLLKSLGK